VCFASDGSHLYCGFETGSILQLDPASGKAVTRLTKVHNAGINRLLGVPQQPSLVAAGDMDGGLCIWDLRSQQHVLKYGKHGDYISGLTVSEKQQALLAVSGDGTLSVHDLRSCKALARSEDDADDELMSGEVLGQTWSNWSTMVKWSKHSIQSKADSAGMHSQLRQAKHSEKQSAVAL
jgi:ATP-dependent RNA helicase DOB1